MEQATQVVAPGLLGPGPAETRPRWVVWLDGVLGLVDALFNRVYGSALNPLHKSGPLAILFLVVTLVTGIYLFIFYQVADPYGSVARLDGTWLGSFVRSLHRYSADLAVVAVAIHALKMLLSGRSRGQRALAWRTGFFLLGCLLLCGWTGLVMAWDVQGQLVAIEGARLIDLFPLFSEPISRSFTSPESVGRAFFFMNLFAHVALPLGLAGLFWLHSSRVARATILPPRKIAFWALVLAVAVSILVPVPLPPEADLLARPVAVPLDLFYAFWLPVARAVPASVHLLLWVGFFAIGLLLPRWFNPREEWPPASHVERSRCTGCSTCYEDCPYEAISMVARDAPSPLAETVAQVDPALCVSCGICSGSCAPMSVGPPGRTGREQLKELKAVLDEREPVAGQVVALSCRHALADDPRIAAAADVSCLQTGCSGSVHTSVIELLLHRGASGVYLMTCPERDCLYREGPRWLRERVYNDREAELQSRVDKRRVRVGGFATREGARARRAIERFRDDLGTLGGTPAPEAPDPDRECDVRDAYLDEAGERRVR
jgi:coenzyme F420-reducing hydrogenase delta subunit/Pyruvate/2-oxoacid:ferredoxin oxidoreductase delta subunit